MDATPDTAYDHLHIPRVKGMRREVRRELAEVARALLEVHRRDQVHAEASCPLCRAVQQARSDSALAKESS